MPDLDTYQSVYSWRYGSHPLRRIFSEQHKYELWRRIWVAMAQAQHTAGLVSRAELDDLVAHQNDIDIKRILELEKITKHDVMAAIRQYAEKSPIGGGKIHAGATSMDIVDNADMLRMVEALGYIRGQLEVLLEIFAKKIARFADTACMGYTHLQPAEPTTVGYRLAFCAQELLVAYEQLIWVGSSLKTKGFKGAVGTQASYLALFDGNSKKVAAMEAQVLKNLGLTGATISTQVNTRLYEYMILGSLAAVAAACSKFAADVRLMQSPGIGEWSEPFGKMQVGSSAMPFKKNPITSEKICSLARLVAQYPAVALENARHSYLERTLDDSANKRVIISETFLGVDEILTSTSTVISELQVFEKRISFNLAQYGPFAATEAILMEAVKQGANRQDMHELLRTRSLEAWNQIALGGPNPLAQILASDPVVKKYISPKQLMSLLDPRHHVGTAPARARAFVQELKKITARKQKRHG